MLANETINKWVEDGMSKQEATRRWYELARTPLREFRRDVRRDDIRELNMDEQRLRSKL